MIRDEILPYVDGNNLVAPALVTPGTQRACDNGPMYTSEYFDILAKSGQLIEADKKDFADRIGACVSQDGLLYREPVGSIPDPYQTGPDDFYGVLSACKLLRNTELPRRFLKAVFKYKGFLNNSQPGVKTWDSFLIRQFQMLAAMIAAAFPSWKNPLHILIRLLAFPLFFWAALVIFVSCINVPANDTDPRRLSWHLIQTVVPVSIMCKFASLFWYHRLYGTYGASGMRGVAKIYYQLGHPFQKYWID